MSNNRLTRVKDDFPCRIKGCEIEDWLIDLYGDLPVNADVCANCPVMKICNKLAAYEDKEFGGV